MCKTQLRKIPDGAITGSTLVHLSDSWEDNVRPVHAAKRIRCRSFTYDSATKSGVERRMMQLPSCLSALEPILSPRLDAVLTGPRFRSDGFQEQRKSHPGELAMGIQVVWPVGFVIIRSRSVRGAGHQCTGTWCVARWATPRDVRLALLQGRHPAATVKRSETQPCPADWMPWAPNLPRLLLKLRPASSGGERGSFAICRVAIWVAVCS
ncbi:hypothetical protein QBC47DRAFT_374903 [Echria macrotheca]|uniref:Uncharacterized protein n=1 Tax=Echria macrotheca TaxID=438768 RepID=A0AAJ0BJT4_9PEZI|nr:hypothetical protein QBC47DRAFT_374903 [Echria macrotheca]